MKSLAVFAAGVVTAVLIAVAVWLTVANTGACTSPRPASMPMRCDGRSTPRCTVPSSALGRLEAAGDPLGRARRRRRRPPSRKLGLLPRRAGSGSDGLVAGMRPEPPHPMTAAAEWSAEDICWIVEIGIKMHGMPALGARHGPQGIAALTAVVSPLPGTLRKRRRPRRNVVETIYQDPPSESCTVDEAPGRALISTLDLTPMPEIEAEQLLDPGSRCVFNCGPETDPIPLGRGGRRPGRHEAQRRFLAAARRTSRSGRPRVYRAGRHNDRPAARRGGGLAVGHRTGLRPRSGLTVGYRGFWACEA